MLAWSEQNGVGHPAAFACSFGLFESRILFERFDHLCIRRILSVLLGQQLKNIASKSNEKSGLLVKFP